MVTFFGDFDTTETVYIPFNTFTSDDPAASSTITDLVAGDIEIHKDGGLTQRTSDAGVTVSINFDGVTGNHLVSIDLSDNTDAGFYANGSQYAVRMEGTTVDAGTINAWIGAFSIGRTLRPTTAGRTLDVSAGGEAGIDWANVGSPTTAVDLSATDIQLCDTITTYTGNTVQTGDAFARLGAPAGASVSADIATVDGNVDSILTDTGTTLDNHLTDIKGTGFVKDTHSLVDIEAYADLIDDGTSGLAKIATDVAAILVDTAEIGAAGAGLTAVAQAAVATEARLAELDAANLPADIDTLKTGGITKNAAFSNFEFVMYDSTDSITPKTGLTVSGTRSIDGGAFAAVSGTIAEVANGVYQFDALAADTNGDFITWRFTATGADATIVSFKTQT